jgi:hypothetical protein
MIMVAESIIYHDSTADQLLPHWNHINFGRRAMRNPLNFVLVNDVSILFS